jgi:hypothetical protein
MGEAREVGERWFDTISGGDRDAARALLADDINFPQPRDTRAVGRRGRSRRSAARPPGCHTSHHAFAGPVMSCDSRSRCGA